MALLLAAMGCFAVLSQMIGRRRRELGIRVALGASRARVLGSVLGRAGRLGALGVALGAAAAWGATRLLEAHLYGVTPRDPATFAAAAAILLATVLAAALSPALAAARTDPARTLREE